MSATAEEIFERLELSFSRALSELEDKIAKTETMRAGAEAKIAAANTELERVQKELAILNGARSTLIDVQQRNARANTPNLPPQARNAP